MRKWGRLRVPRVVRGQFKLDETQVLRVTVSPVSLIGVREIFFGKMRKDGYIAVPAVVLALLKKDKPSLEGYAVEVTLEPT
jgi:hypothetical protein